MIKRIVAFVAMLAVGGALAGSPAHAFEKSIIVQSTTSTANSGLYDHILPLFEEKTGIRVNVVAVGTGQAIRNARNGDGDVLLVHSKPAEEAFVADGYGVARFDVMYNDFIVVGPREDPVGVGGQTDAVEGLQAIAEARAAFVSRGDNSGTHQKEMALWQLSDVDPVADSGTWYRETGSGMGATLNVAVGMGAYAMTDRGTWISFKNKGRHTVLLEGDDRMFNQYGVVLVNPERHPHIKEVEGRAFIDWILSAEGQGAIQSFSLNDEQLFYPNAADRSLTN